MPGAGELIAQVDVLLAEGQWDAAALHVRGAARQVGSRAEALALRALVGAVPPQVRACGVWPQALSWVAYRAGDLALLDDVLAAAPRPLPAFEAFRAASREDWAGALAWAAQVDPADADAPVARRFQARAQAARRCPGWQEAFHAAAAQASGRDRGLLYLEFGSYLSLSGLDAQARDAYAHAVTSLRGDPWALTLAYANWGIACLRLGDLAAAERALQTGLAAACRPGGEAHRSTVWRGLGGLAVQRGLPARAVHAFGQARDCAAVPADRLAALRGLARAWRLRGQTDEAALALYQALEEADVLEDGRHPAFADLAAVQLRAGDDAGARVSLGRVQTVTDADAWRVQVVQAELRRRAGQPVDLTRLTPLDPTGLWQREEARVFPELFALLGISVDSARPRAVVHTDGAIRLTLDGAEVPLKPHRPAAALLAFLVAHGGVASTERALEALSLPGNTVRLRQQELSRAVRELRQGLGWPDAVHSGGGLLRLTGDLDWTLEYPVPARADLFCEGRLDPWITGWRQANLSPDSYIF